MMELHPNAKLKDNSNNKDCKQIQVYMCKVNSTKCCLSFNSDFGNLIIHVRRSIIRFANNHVANDNLIASYCY